MLGEMAGEHARIGVVTAGDAARDDQGDVPAAVEVVDGVGVGERGEDE